MDVPALIFFGAFVVSAAILLGISMSRAKRSFVPNGADPKLPPAGGSGPPLCAPPLLPHDDKQGVLDWVIRNVLSSNWSSI